jgi:Alkylmercury lyase
VEAAGRSWYGNCAWDAIGICAALHVEGSIETSCPDCGETIRLEVAGRREGHAQLLFHCLVPASRWWKDIVST